ncbi:hypothetical protein BJ165DRAFT_289121 [Panaeolus papilionaceus]|nr:hypothetical protein BJ165DRAFT_289121 [Panaeolus papilionaceus]
MIPNYPADISNDQYKGALRLATLWNFDDIRNKAIKVLETNTATDPIERISVAREFRIRSWLISGYGELITGPAETLKPRGCAATLGWEALALIYYARNEYGTGPSQDPVKLAEYLNSGNSGIGYRCPSCPKRHVAIEMDSGDFDIYTEPPEHRIGSRCERLRVMAAYMWG